MRRKTFTMGLTGLLIGAWLTGQLLSADPAASKTSGEDLAKLQRQIAETSLKLAENELQVLVEANKRLPNTFPKAAVERAQQIVEVAKARAGEVGKDADADAHANYLGLTAAEMTVAETQYKAALAATQQIKNAVPPLELQRLALTANLTKLRHERAKLAGSVPALVLLSWQLEDLREQVRNLSRQVELYRGNE